MVLNAVQQNSLLGWWDFLRRSFEAAQPRDALLDFLAELASIDPSQPLTDSETNNLEGKVQLLAPADQEEAQQLIDIFGHSCPQNRSTGDRSCGQDCGYVNWYSNGFGSHALHERRGILSLTSNNQPAAQRNPKKPGALDAYYPNPEAVCRRDVVVFLQLCAGTLMAHLQGLALQEEGLAAHTQAGWQAALQLDAEHLCERLAKMQGALDREQENAKRQSASQQTQLWRLKQEKTNAMRQLQEVEEALRLASQQKQLESLEQNKTNVKWQLQEVEEALRHVRASQHQKVLSLEEQLKQTRENLNDLQRTMEGLQKGQRGVEALQQHVSQSHADKTCAYEGLDSGTAEIDVLSKQDFNSAHQMSSLADCVMKGCIASELPARSHLHSCSTTSSLSLPTLDLPLLAQTRCSMLLDGTAYPLVKDGGVLAEGGKRVPSPANGSEAQQQLKSPTLGQSAGPDIAAGSPHLKSGSQRSTWRALLEGWLPPKHGKAWLTSTRAALFL